MGRAEEWVVLGEVGMRVKRAAERSQLKFRTSGKAHLSGFAFEDSSPRHLSVKSAKVTGVKS